MTYTDGTVSMGKSQSLPLSEFKIMKLPPISPIDDQLSLLKIAFSVGNY